MPVRTEAASLIPPPPINTQQPGVATTLLYSGSKFRGHQKSKGNSYDVEVVLQVKLHMLLSLACSHLGMHIIDQTCVIDAMNIGTKCWE